MLGWEIYIYEKLPKKNSTDHLVNARLAVDGLAWIEPLIKKGEAEYIGGNGYPDFYKVKAKDILVFMSKHPKLDQTKIKAFNGESMLFVEAWDQS